MMDPYNGGWNNGEDGGKKKKKRSTPSSLIDRTYDDFSKHPAEVLPPQVAYMHSQRREIGIQQPEDFEGKTDSQIGTVEGGNNDEDRGKKKKKRSTPSSLIDRTYYDYSTYQLSEVLPPEAIENTPEDGQKPKGRYTFPMKLYGILSDPAYRHIIRWMPHGRSWKILNKELVESVVCRENFNHGNFDSFNRSVNGWGFKRLMRAGPDHRSYYHELFLRGRPDLAQAIPRLKNPGKRIPDPKGEPNFYEISRRFPLTPDPYDEPGESNVDVDEEEAPHQQPQQAEMPYNHQQQQQAEMPYNPLQHPNYEQQPAQHAPPPAREHQRYSFPPDASLYHGYPPGYGYGYGHYPPPPYPPYPHLYPYQHPPGPCYDPYGHHQFRNPYTSPESHLSAHYYNQQYYVHSPHHAHDAVGARPSYEQHSQEANAEMQGYEWAPHEHQLQPHNLNQNVKPKIPYSQSPRIHPLVIHSPASAPFRSSDAYGHGYSLSVAANQQYDASSAATAHSYPSESWDWHTGYKYENYARGLQPAQRYKREYSTSSQEELPEYPTELDKRKPPARNISSAPPATTMPSRDYDRYEYETYSEEPKPAKAIKRQHSSASPAELDEWKPPAIATGSTAHATMQMSPIKQFDSHLEWSESFSSNVSDYVLGTTQNEPSQRDFFGSQGGCKFYLLPKKRGEKKGERGEKKRKKPVNRSSSQINNLSTT